MPPEWIKAGRMPLQWIKAGRFGSWTPVRDEEDILLERRGEEWKAACCKALSNPS